jgi:S-formylglutathione hydrolase FrmB
VTVAPGPLSRLVATGALVLGGLALAPGDVSASEGEAVPLVRGSVPACPPGEACVVDVDVPHPVEVVVPGGERPGNRVRLILPPGYEPEGRREHPVVLLLHGAGDGSETWVENTDVDALVAELCTGPVAACPVVVMPDSGGKHSEPGWYTDWYDGSRHWETFHTHHVVPWVKQHLDVAACGDRWTVAGLSMGGFGALSYAALHPDLFAGVASFSGFVDSRPGAPLSSIGFRLAAEAGLGAPTEEVFGPQATLLEEDGWSARNPTDRARAGDYRAYGGNVWIATGTGTIGGPAGDELDNQPAYALEAFIAVLHQTFAMAMVESGTPYHDQSYLGGPHTWPYWQMALRRALPEMLEVLPASCAGGATGPGAQEDGTELPSAGMADEAEAPPVHARGSGALPATGGGRAAAPAVLAVLGLALLLQSLTRRASSTRLIS